MKTRYPSEQVNASSLEVFQSYVGGYKPALTASTFWFGGTVKIFWICIMDAMLRISWEQPKFPGK